MIFPAFSRLGRQYRPCSTQSRRSLSSLLDPPAQQPSNFGHHFTDMLVLACGEPVPLVRQPQLVQMSTRLPVTVPGYPVRTRYPLAGLRGLPDAPPGEGAQRRQILATFSPALGRIRHRAYLVRGVRQQRAGLDQPCALRRYVGAARARTGTRLKLPATGITRQTKKIDSPDGENTGGDSPPATCGRVPPLDSRASEYRDQSTRGQSYLIGTAPPHTRKPLWSCQSNGRRRWLRRYAARA